jgi:hypothetical protein
MHFLSFEAMLIGELFHYAGRKMVQMPGYIPGGPVCAILFGILRFGIGHGN